MSNQGSTLQNYNSELVKCIEDLREKREELNRQILKVVEVALLRIEPVRVSFRRKRTRVRSRRSWRCSRIVSKE